MYADEVLLSIIIPVYNTAEYIRTCLESVYAIQIKQKEIILVNDGSTDSSATILNEYQQKYPDITHLITQKNQGLSAARNHGLDLATGKYVIFIDSDDFIIANRLEKLVELSVKNDLDIIFGNYLETNENGESLKIAEEIPDISKIQVNEGIKFYESRSLNDISIIAAWIRICKRDFLNKYQIRFIKGLFFEDVPFSLCCAIYAKRVSQVDIPFYLYRQRRGSIVKTPSLQKQIHKLYIVDYLIEQITIHKIKSEFWNNYILSVYFDVLRRSNIKNTNLYPKVSTLDKLRVKEQLKKMCIPFLHLQAKESDINL